MGKMRFDLTSREREVLSYVHKGISQADIAKTLHISPGRVQEIARQTRGKLQRRKTKDAAREAKRRGWI